jgi:hypothetical protein
MDRYVHGPIGKGMTYPFGRPATKGQGGYHFPQDAGASADSGRAAAPSDVSRPLPRKFDFPIAFFWSAEPLCATGVHARVTHRLELNAIHCMELANLLLTLPHH